MPSNRPRFQGSTKTPFERERARDAYRRRQARRQRAAAYEDGGNRAEHGADRVQGLEGHPSDAGHAGMTGDRDQAASQFQQPAEAAVQEASSSVPRLEITRLAHDMSTLAIADPAVQQRDAQLEQPKSGPEDSAQATGDVTPADHAALNLDEDMDFS
ncbi:hypothetical protein AU210_010150 [Fusarium oxysporum f. sp. radicis-cucumerinum]|uniref:Uncharacterized protein n=1 Tax=Fusarium oxysporum f. sp. radicis-cucumerinum TaxID=327505 RepID=A0A2H3GZ94_FUSOX|nr:hypothetical protein AU210_010150 [Fusarium oxysporum f. sp. radicis-cucumerinum]